MTKKIETALLCAKRNLFVVPFNYQKSEGICSCDRANCELPGRHPLLPDFSYSATTDRGVIKNWWKEHENANVGVMLSQESGLNYILELEYRFFMEMKKEQKEWSNVVRFTKGANEKKRIILLFSHDQKQEFLDAAWLKKGRLYADGEFCVLPSIKNIKKWELSPKDSDITPMFQSCNQWIQNNSISKFTDNGSIKQINTCELIPNPDNPKSLRKSPIDDLASLIEKDGIQQPIEVTYEGIIVKGHRRVATANYLGMKMVPAFIKQYASKEERDRAMLGSHAYRDHTLEQKLELAMLWEPLVKKEAEKRRCRPLLRGSKKPSKMRTRVKNKDTGETLAIIGKRLNLSANSVRSLFKIKNFIKASNEKKDFKSADELTTLLEKGKSIRSIELRMDELKNKGDTTTSLLPIQSNKLDANKRKTKLIEKPSVKENKKPSEKIPPEPIKKSSLANESDDQFLKCLEKLEISYKQKSQKKFSLAFTEVFKLYFMYVNKWRTQKVG